MSNAEQTKSKRSRCGLEPDWIREDLASLEEMGLRRSRRAMEKRQPGRIVVDGIEYLDFASNDYLGLAADRNVTGAAVEFLNAHGFGSAASPLVTGYHRIHERLENELADFTGAEAVLLFGSGFGANVGVLSAVMGPEDIVFCEKRNHASLIDGCRLSKARLRVFRSDQLETLASRLSRTTGYRRRWIVTDSIFSMDGDCAPLRALCELAERHDADMYVDEAHALGIFGQNGRGLAEQEGVEDCIAIRLGTLGKAAGAVGGFMMTSTRWSEWLMHHARSFMYSTALPGACAAAALAALEQMRIHPERRAYLLESADTVRQGLREAGFDTGKSTTQIVPLLLGSPLDAVKLADRLRLERLWTAPIRPPTVPTGTSRIRISVSSAHSRRDIDSLITAIGKSGRE